MRIFSLLFSVFGILTTTVNSWTVHKGQIYTSENQIFNLSGCSWFGFETQDYVLNGLWNHPIDFYLDMIKSVNINVLRIPVSSEWIFYNFDLYPFNGLISSDSSLQGLKSIQILDRLFDLCQERGIYIMLDLHRLHKEYISELWYSPTDDLYTTNTFFTTWFKLLDRYEKRSNLIAIDLLNEPHGRATWGNTSPATDWNIFVQYAIQKLNDRYPKNEWLYLVEGIGWGKDLSNVLDLPLQFNDPHITERIVYSPHTYGKSVVSSVDPYNKNQLYNDWEYAFGYLSQYDYTIMIGEYGGITEIDSQWLLYLVEYLKEIKQTNAFYWSLGPNSGDVHGLLLDDWTTFDSFKIDIINSLQPYPTF